MSDFVNVQVKVPKKLHKFMKVIFAKKGLDWQNFLLKKIEKYAKKFGYK